MSASLASDLDIFAPGRAGSRIAGAFLSIDPVEMACFCTLVWPLLRQSHAKDTIFRPTECCVAYRRFHHGIGNIIPSLSYRDALGSPGVPLELSCYLAVLIAFRPPESFLCPDFGQHPFAVRQEGGHFAPTDLSGLCYIPITLV